MPKRVITPEPNEDDIQLERSLRPTRFEDFVGQEQYQITPGSSFAKTSDGPEAAFQALMVAGVPIFADHFCPKGNAFFPNVKYTAMYLSEDAAFDFSGFYSLVPLGQTAVFGLLALGSEDAALLDEVAATAATLSTGRAAAGSRARRAREAQVRSRGR